MTASSYLYNIVQPTQDDVFFWKEQAIGHALYLSTMLNPANDLRKEAADFYTKITSPRLSYDAVFMLQFFAFLEVVRSKVYDVPNITVETSNDNFYLSICHIIMEHTYTARLLGGRMTVKEEVIFWLDENSSHLELIARIISDDMMRSEALVIIDRINQAKEGISRNDVSFIPIALNIIKAALDYGNILYNEAAAKRIDLDKRMVLHEVKESNRAVNRLKIFVQATV